MENKNPTVAGGDPAALNPTVLNSSSFLPVMNLSAAVERRAQLLAFIDQCMIEGDDYGVIPGTESNDPKKKKPRKTLLKPGAEKLCNLFGLEVTISAKEEVLDWTGGDHGSEPFFYSLYRYSLYRDGRRLGEGEGSCNSWEKKYRYRSSDRKCPQCQAAAILKSRNEGEGFFCWAKKGGCGAKFHANDQSITGQQLGQVANPDAADVVNTIQKMAQKRGLVCAVLIATGTSDIFGQDREEDIRPTGEDTGGKVEPKASGPAASPQPAKKDPEPARTQHPTDATPKADDGARLKAMKLAFQEQIEKPLGIGNFQKQLRAGGYARLDDITDPVLGSDLFKIMLAFVRGVEKCRAMVALLDKDLAGQIAYNFGVIEPAECADAKDLEALGKALKAAVEAAKAVAA
jgi:hypothetical protein